MNIPVSRRTVLTAAASAAALPSWRCLASSSETAAEIVIDPTPVHELSPYLYMQFMEPLGATDGSVEAAWDHVSDCWRPDVIRATQELAPTMMRWGGIFTDYYRWKEGVGPRGQRPAMTNLLWGGIESNQVGTAEFVDFCRQVSAVPLMCVNFESDGRQRYMKAREGVRTASAAEAAEWVAYCNQSDHPERTAHGSPQPFGIRHWQIGNETSYDRRGFDLETAARKTVEFAKAMKTSDPSIELIGWGDSNWASRMLDVAGEYLDYVAVHHMFNPDTSGERTLGELHYRDDPDQTWQVLMDAVGKHERKLLRAREMVSGYDVPLALTECHYSIGDRDRCDVLSSWAAGVSYARLLNLHQRHGDVLKIATAADFCGNRWQVNAIMIPTPASKGSAYLMPVARVMSLYRHHTGQQAVQVSRAPDDLDIAASRTGDTLFLHVANLNRTRSVTASIDAGELTAQSGRVFEIAVDSTIEITRFRPDVLNPVRKTWRAGQPWVFPAASVTAIELDCQAAG